MTLALLSGCSNTNDIRNVHKSNTSSSANTSSVDSSSLATNSTNDGYKKEINPAIGTGTAEDLLGKQPTDGTLASINGKDITEDDLNQILPVLQYIYQKKSDDKDWEDFKNYAIQYLVSSKLYYLLMTDNKLTIDEKELNDTLQSVINSTGNSDDFYKEIADYKISESDVKEFLRAEQAYSTLYDFSTANITVTNDEIQKYYNDNKDGFTNITSRDFYQILFDDKDTAQKALDSILDGSKTFDEVADENKSEDGGYVATVSTGDLVAPFEDLVWKLKENEVYGQIEKTDLGYHIITAKNFIENKTYSLEDVKDSIKKTLLKQKQDAAMQELVNNGVTKYSVSIY